MAGEEFDFAEPDHPDHDRLADVLARHIDIPATAEGADFDIQTMIGSVVDPKSAVYVALTRAVASAHIKDPQDLQLRMGEVMERTLLWLDAFYGGIHFERERP